MSETAVSTRIHKQHRLIYSKHTVSSVWRVSERERKGKKYIVNIRLCAHTSFFLFTRHITFFRDFMLHYVKRARDALSLSHLHYYTSLYVHTFCYMEEKNDEIEKRRPLKNKKLYVEQLIRIFNFKMQQQNFPFSSSSFTLMLSITCIYYYSGT